MQVRCYGTLVKVDSVAFNESVFGRIQVTDTDFLRSAALSIGPELTGQGNHDAHQFEAGGMLELGLLRTHASLQFRAGYARLWFVDGSTDSRPYFGVGFYHRF